MFLLQEYINGYSRNSDAFSNGKIAILGTDSSSPNSSYQFYDESDDFHSNTLKAVEFPHALQSGFGESSTDKTLPKKMSKKDKLRYKVNDKRKSIEMNGIDPNFNNVMTDTMCSKKGMSTITVENETITNPSPSEDSTGSLIERDNQLINDKNAELFSYSNPAFSPDESTNPETCITPPREFQDSTQEIAAAERPTEPNVAIVLPRIQNPPPDPVDEGERRLSVKQRASLFEQQKLDQNRTNSSSNNSNVARLSDSSLINGKPTAHVPPSLPEDRTAL